MSKAASWSDSGPILCLSSIHHPSRRKRITRRLLITLSFRHVLGICWVLSISQRVEPLFLDFVGLLGSSWLLAQPTHFLRKDLTYFAKVSFHYFERLFLCHLLNFDLKDAPVRIVHVIVGSSPGQIHDSAHAPAKHLDLLATYLTSCSWCKLTECLPDCGSKFIISL